MNQTRHETDTIVFTAVYDHEKQAYRVTTDRRVTPDTSAKESSIGDAH